ncbi:MAG: alkaline phosphatase family protein [Planctomycetota bacterium]
MDRSSRLTDKVVLVGWDAADWRMITPLLEAGQMPALQSLIDRGVSGNLASARPMLSPMLWNTIATGKRPDQHGVHGFTEPLPDGSNVRPVASTSRQCKAVWNIANQCGLRSLVVGWYASHPAEPIQGAMVSNRFEQPVAGLDEPWPVPPGAVHPPEMEAALAALRVHPAEMMDPQILLPFIPTAGEGEAAKDKRVRALAALLAQTSTIHATATHLMANTEWDLACIYYESIDRFGHEFMEFHPPRQPGIDEAEFERYRHCMVGAYRFQDMMLHAVLREAGDDATVIVMSDHGYYHDNLRPDPKTAGPVDWHRPFGIAAMAGPGIRPGARLAGASIHDVTPTILDLLGLPIGHDMPGRPWAEAFDAPDNRQASRLLSWEQVEGDDGRHADDVAEDPESAREALQQLIDLGYIDAPDDETQATVEKTRIINSVNLATALSDAGRHAKAVDVLEPLLEHPEFGKGVRLQLASAYAYVGRRDEARALVDAVAAEAPGDFGIAWAASGLDMIGERFDLALERLRGVTAEGRTGSLLAYRIGTLCLGLRRFTEAGEAFRKTLEIDPDHANAHAGLASVANRQRRYEDAVDHALTAIELIFFLPRAHFRLGYALFKLDRVDNAIEAFETAVRQAPSHERARRMLVRTLRTQGRQADADEHAFALAQLRKRRSDSGSGDTPPADPLAEDRW